MNNITRATLSQFTDVFDKLHDAVIREVRFCIPCEDSKSIHLVLDAIDYRVSPVQGDRCHYMHCVALSILFDEVHEFRFEEPLNYCNTVVFAGQFSFNEGLVWLDLYDAWEERDGEDPDITKLRQSQVFFAAKKASWKMEAVDWCKHCQLTSGARDFEPNR